MNFFSGILICMVINNIKDNNMYFCSNDDFCLYLFLYKNSFFMLKIILFNLVEYMGLIFIK